jgi:hypothetical protein
VPWFRQSGDRVVLGQAPVAWHGRLQNDPTTLRLVAGWPFLGAHLITDRFGGRTRHPDPAFTLSRADIPVVSGNLTGTGGFTTEAFTVNDLAGDRYTLRTAFLALLRGHPSTLEVLAEFDTRLPDRNPPWLRSLHVEVDGEATDSVAFIGASDAAVRFELGDGEGGLTLPTLAVRPIDQEWEPLVVTDEGGAYAASLPPHLDGVIAMKLEGVDVSGNRLTLHWDRAFIARSLRRTCSSARGPLWWSTAS